MLLGIGPCFVKLRLAGGMNLEQWVIFGDNFTCGSQQPDSSRDVGRCPGALGDAGDLPAIDFANAAVCVRRDYMTEASWGRQLAPALCRHDIVELLQRHA